MRSYDDSKAWKRKKDGKIVTLVSRSYSSTSTSFRIIGEDGVSVDLEEEQFNLEFEPIHLDFQTVKDQLAEFCNLSMDFCKLGMMVMKRLDPSYFEVGKLVYIYNYSFFKRDSCYYLAGPEHPYIIKYIKTKSSNIGIDTYLEIGICALNKRESCEIDYTFPIYPARPDSEDAYWFLSRYDKPY